MISNRKCGLQSWWEDLKYGDDDDDKARRKAKADEFDYAVDLNNNWNGVNDDEALESVSIGEQMKEYDNINICKEENNKVRKKQSWIE